jgi:hypothetical protein
MKNLPMAIPTREVRREPEPRYRRRILVAVPPGGFGAQLATMRVWLDKICGPAGWTFAPAGRGGVVNDAIAFYFVEPDHADVFIRRFCCGYRG